MDSDAYADPVQHLAPDQRAAVLHAAGPPASSRPRARARPPCSPPASAISCSSAATGTRACPRSRTTAGRAPRCRTGSRIFPGNARHKVRTLNSLGYEIVRRARPGVRVVDEREVRERIEPHVKLTFRANTDAVRPYLEALEEVQLGLRAPAHVERQRGDVDGFAAMYDLYRDTLERDDAIDFDSQIAGAVEALSRDPHFGTAVPTRVPAPARRRVPRPPPRAPAARAAHRRARLRRVRRRRRRPGHLRLLRRRPRLPHQLRPLLPRRRRSPARGQLPVPAGRGRRRPDAAVAQPAPGRQGDPRRARPRADTRSNSRGATDRAPPRRAARAPSRRPDRVVARRGVHPESIAVLCGSTPASSAVQVLAHDRGLPGDRGGRRELPAPHRSAERAGVPANRVPGSPIAVSCAAAISPRSYAAPTGDHRNASLTRSATGGGPSPRRRRARQLARLGRHRPHPRLRRRPQRPGRPDLVGRHGGGVAGRARRRRPRHGDGHARPVGPRSPTPHISTTSPR